jgi:hypothetical protein
MSKKIIQTHHIQYNPPIVVRVFKGEHGILTRMQWWCKKEVSKGFIKALRYFIKERAKKSKEI